MLGYKYKRGQQGFENWTIEATALEDVFRLGLDRHWTCVKTRSLEYLASPHFDGFDVYLVDGDHNYYTVSKELELIYTYCKVGDIVLFNDVVGEWSRHDQYYDPEFIPAEYVGGRKQGVLTAIEDFVNSFNERRPWWRKKPPVPVPHSDEEARRPGRVDACELMRGCG